MSKATFYEHFDNKEDCIVALFDAGAEAVIEAMRQAGAQAEGARPGRPRAGHRPHLPGGARRVPGRGPDAAGGDHRAGPRAMERRDRALAEYARTIDDVNREDAELGWAPRLASAARRVRRRGRGGRARVAADPHGRAARHPRPRAGGRAARRSACCAPARRRGSAGVERRRRGERGALRALEAEVHECRRCPRLVAWRETVAAEKRAAFRDEEYWGRPIAGFGDPARAHPPARAGPGRPRRQPHGPRVHRRPLGRLPLRRAAPGRPGRPAGLALARRRAHAHRLLDHGGGPLRAAGQQAAARGARRVRRLAARRGAAAGGRARRALPRRLRLGRRAAAAGRAPRAPSRASATAPRRRPGRGRCWAASTRASRTRSRGA